MVPTLFRIRPLAVATVSRVKLPVATKRRNYKWCIIARTAGTDEEQYNTLLGVSKIIRLPRSSFAANFRCQETSWQPDYFAHPKYFHDPKHHLDNSLPPYLSQSKLSKPKPSNFSHSMVQNNAISHGFSHAHTRSSRGLG